MFNRLCLIGVGLIGGSIARAARVRGLAKQFVGFGREADQHNLDQAKRLGVIDEYYLSIAEAVEGADGVVIATPVAAFEAVFTQLKPYWAEDAVYTDVGSTKGNVLAAAERVFGCVPDNFIPAHPIAGAENSGVEAAVDNLFVNKRLIVTPTESSNPDAVRKIRQFWEQLGSVVSVMDVAQHDSVLAATSHLPHILAFALVDMLGRKDEQNEIFKYAAGGFKDFTRIASSDPTMWRDICLANKNELVPLIGQFKAELDKIQNLLAQDDGEQLFETFAYARQARQRFLDQFLN
jgi:prephenate dehydrogenase